MKRIIPIIVFALSIALGVTAFAQTTQPEAQEEVAFWTNLSTEKLALYAAGIVALIVALNKIGDAVGELVKKWTKSVIEWFFGTKKLIADKQREAEADKQAMAKAITALTDANLKDPNTPDLQIDPSTEARVRAISTGTGDGTTPL